MITKNETNLVNKMKFLGFSLITDRIRRDYLDRGISVDTSVEFMELLVDTEEALFLKMREILN
uniref:hypothetical protein n=1 Tax=Xenorhabdus sp. BG5 TaxID=2782014 RepID=UPI001D15DE3F